MAHIDSYSTILGATRASMVGEQRINDGGRVLLPQTCLNEMSVLTMVYPLQFKISTKHRKPKYVYAAVLEFTAERGTVVLPDWMADHLELKGTAVVTLETCNVGGANIIKLQPHTQDFIALGDPRAVLERHLTNYPVLMEGTSIVIRHAQRDFRLKIVELLDSRQKKVEAVLSARADSLATEVKVEFERPMDMPEEEELEDIAPYVPHATQAGSSISAGSGSPTAISFSPVNFRPPSISSGAKASDVVPAQSEEEEKNDPSFVPFGGMGKPLSAGGTKTPNQLTDAQIREARLARLRKMQAKKD